MSRNAAALCLFYDFFLSLSFFLNEHLIKNTDWWFTVYAATILATSADSLCSIMFQGFPWDGFLCTPHANLKLLSSLLHCHRSESLLITDRLCAMLLSLCRVKIALVMWVGVICSTSVPLFLYPILSIKRRKWLSFCRKLSLFLRAEDRM